MNIELVAIIKHEEVSPPAGQPMTVEQGQELIRKAIALAQMRVTEIAAQKMGRDANIVHDLREYQHLVEQQQRINTLIIERLRAIEKKLHIIPPSGYREIKGNWNLSTHSSRAIVAAQHRRKALPAPAWQKQAEAEAKKIRAELPPFSSLSDLVRRFGVSRCRLDAMVGRGEIKAIRQGSHIRIPREEVVEYVKHNGIPRPKGRHYGSR